MVSYLRVQTLIHRRSTNFVLLGADSTTLHRKFDSVTSYFRVHTPGTKPLISSPCPDMMNVHLSARVCQALRILKCSQSLKFRQLLENRSDFGVLVSCTSSPGSAFVRVQCYVSLSALLRKAECSPAYFRMHTHPKLRE